MKQKQSLRRLLSISFLFFFCQDCFSQQQVYINGECNQLFEDYYYRPFVLEAGYRYNQIAGGISYSNSYYQMDKLGIGELGGSARFYFVAKQQGFNVYLDAKLRTQISTKREGKPISNDFEPALGNELLNGHWTYPFYHRAKNDFQLSFGFAYTHQKWQCNAALGWYRRIWSYYWKDESNTSYPTYDYRDGIINKLFFSLGITYTIFEFGKEK